MKRIAGFVVLALAFACMPEAHAQFKSQAQQEAMVDDASARPSASSSLFFGWFNPANFQMHHTFDLSYQTAGGQGFSMGTYTNSMMYQFSDRLNAQADVSMSYSPFNSFSTVGNKKNDLSSIYLSRAQLDYKPWDNVLVQVQYRQIPYGTAYFSPFYNPWVGGNGF